MPNAYISGTGFYVPPRVVTNDDLRTQYGIDTTHEWIVQRTGIEERRFAEEGVGSADLGAFAAEKAIESAGIAKTDLDMIIFATLSPEHCFPGSGVYMQKKLGLCDGAEREVRPRARRPQPVLGLPLRARHGVLDGEVRRGQARARRRRRGPLGRARSLDPGPQRRFALRRRRGRGRRQRHRRGPRHPQLEPRRRRPLRRRPRAARLGHPQAPVHPVERGRRRPGAARDDVGADGRQARLQERRRAHDDGA